MGLRLSSLSVVSAVLAISLAPNIAAAGDFNNAPQETFFGNIHTSVAGVVQSNSGGSVFWPSVNLGAKGDYEFANSPFGFQFDIDGNGHAYSWDSPAQVYGGVRADIVNALHGTYAINDDVKLGVFVSTTTENHFLSNITDPTFNYKGHTNLSSAYYVRTEGVLGAEALLMLNPNSWVQGHLGLTNKIAASTMWTDATTGAVTNANYIVNQDYGFQVGGSARFGLTPNFSMRGDANLNVMLPFAGGYDDNLTTLVTGQYAIDDTSLALYGQLGYTKFFSDAGTSDDYIARTGVVMSFGGTTPTVRGKLFRTVGTQGSIN